MFSTQVLSVDLTLYYRDGCSHCEKEMEFLDSIRGNYSFNLMAKEVSSDPIIIRNIFLKKNVLILQVTVFPHL
jgi:glutaredoxin